jgi:hypothetical protein
MKILQMGSVYFHADRQSAVMAKVIDAFRNIGKASKSYKLWDLKTLVYNRMCTSYLLHIGYVRSLTMICV